jgi:hypothetical protein
MRLNEHQSLKIWRVSCRLLRIRLWERSQHPLVGNSGPFNLSTVQRFNVAKPLV